MITAFFSLLLLLLSLAISGLLPLPIEGSFSLMQIPFFIHAALSIYWSIKYHFRPTTELNKLRYTIFGTLPVSAFVTMIAWQGGDGGLSWLLVVGGSIMLVILGCCLGKVLNRVTVNQRDE
jgi:hypothetical protein